MQIEILHLGVGRGDTGVKSGPEGWIQRLEHAGTGHQRAEQQIAGGRISIDGEIKIDRAIRIEPGMVLIENKPISGLRSEIIDRIKDIFRIQAVDRLQRVNNSHW